MIRNQDTPPDDLTDLISEIVGDILRHVPFSRRARITGYAILSPGSFSPPVVFRVIGIGDGHPRMPYETIETEDTIFITAKLPPGTIHPVNVEFLKNGIRIFLDERAASLPFKITVDIPRSNYSVRNGILDITVAKQKKS